MIAVKKHYLKATTSRDQFVKDIMSWVKDPSEKNSRMPGALRKFGIMPYTPYKLEDIELIASYIFDNDIEQPEWFKEHYQQEHGKKGQGMGRGKNKNE